MACASGHVISHGDTGRACNRYGQNSRTDCRAICHQHFCSRDYQRRYQHRIPHSTYITMAHLRLLGESNGIYRALCSESSAVLGLLAGLTVPVFGGRPVFVMIASSAFSGDDHAGDNDCNNGDDQQQKNHGRTPGGSMAQYRHVRYPHLRFYNHIYGSRRAHRYVLTVFQIKSETPNFSLHCIRICYIQ